MLRVVGPLVSTSQGASVDESKNGSACVQRAPKSARAVLHGGSACVEHYHPRILANISGAQIVASDSTMNFGVVSASLPHVIFSFGTAPEYEP